MNIKYRELRLSWDPTMDHLALLYAVIHVFLFLFINIDSSGQFFHVFTFHRGEWRTLQWIKSISRSTNQKWSHNQSARLFESARLIEQFHDHSCKVVNLSEYSGMSIAQYQQLLDLMSHPAMLVEQWRVDVISRAIGQREQIGVSSLCDWRHFLFPLSTPRQPRGRQYFT